jgi:hypothetical protein
MTGLFWAIFSHFSMLGDQARLYLLQTKTLGRLLDIFLNLGVNLDQCYFGRNSCLLYK